MDNTQFRFGQALRSVENTFGNLLDTLKKTYLTHVCGFRLESICVMTLLFEGDFLICLLIILLSLYNWCYSTVNISPF